MTHTRGVPLAAVLSFATLTSLGFFPRIGIGNEFLDPGSRVQFSESWFDRTCFGQLTAAMTRRRCMELLQKRVELADETIELDDKQKKKLLVAGQIDIHRYFSTYDQLKRSFEFGVISSKEWQERVKIVHLQSRPFIDEMEAGLNGNGSLYHKALITCVGQQKAASVDDSYRVYAKERYASKIDQTLKQVLRNSVDRKLVGSENRTVGQGVTDLLLESTEPPEFYGNSRNYIHTVVAKLMLVQDQLNVLLNDREMKMIESLYRVQHRFANPAKQLERKQ